ncbi:hypothetical protein MLPF_1237 [Mycobacterium lepromatosis]|nr:hypothetical protein MLPF_1237 [Mycobacterium lepromatosis]
MARRAGRKWRRDTNEWPCVRVQLLFLATTAMNSVLIPRIISALIILSESIHIGASAGWKVRMRYDAPPPCPQPIAPVCH